MGFLHQVKIMFTQNNIMLSVLLVSLVSGYSYKIHRFLGNMLGDHLESNHNDIYNKVVNDLNGTSISEASVWADKVKRTKKYYWTKKMHYVNLKSCSVVEDEVEEVCADKNGCIYTFIKELLSREHTNLTSEENIKFLLHSLQDINQPLHVYDRDRGGNNFKLIRNKRGINRTISLHSLWDNEIPSHYIKNFYNKEAILMGYNTTMLEVINFNLGLNCGYIYNIENNFIVFENYFNHLMVRALFDNYISLSVSILERYYM